MAEYTKGEWKQGKPYADKPIIIWGGKPGKRGAIAQLIQTDNEHPSKTEIADAHLIAAAPAMYEALRKLRAYQDFTGSQKEGKELYQTAIRQADQALAEAEGKK